MSQERLPYILQELCREWEVLNKFVEGSERRDVAKGSVIPSGALGGSGYVNIDGEQTSLTSLSSLHAQLLIAYVTSRCLAAHWTLRQPTSFQQREPVAALEIPTLARKDPPPLDTALAKLLLSVASSILAKRSSTAGKADSGVADSLYRLHGVASTSSSSWRSFSSEYTMVGGQAKSSITTDTLNITNSRTTTNTTSPQPHHRGLPAASQRDDEPRRRAVSQDLVTCAGVIIAYVSASRWDIVLAKQRSRMVHYVNADDLPQVTEARMLGFFHLNDARVASLLQEMSLLPKVSNTAQLALCQSLRVAISHFISTPRNSDFMATLYYGDGRHPALGQADDLFDIVVGISDSQGSKAVTWPLLALLLALCPATVTKLAQGEDLKSPAMFKKVQWLDAIRKAARPNGRDSPASITSCAELCQAASYTGINEHEASALRVLVNGLANEVEVRDVQNFTI